MQSLDSSCQEADFIINDTLLKLKGSAVQTNSTSVLRHQPSTSAQFQNQQSPQQHHNQYQSLQQSSSLSRSLLNSSLLQIPSQPPQYIFDGVDSSPDYSNLTVGLNDSDLLASVDVADPSSASITTLANNSLASPTLLSNINSIISPSPVVPDTLLSTSPTTASSTSFTLIPPTNTSSPSTSQGIVGSHKSEKRTIRQHSPQVTEHSITSSPNKRQKTTTSSSSTQRIGNSSNASSSKNDSSSSASASKSQPSTSNAPSTSGSSNSNLFDIHEKIRELYLEMLVNDEEIFNQTGRRHRTRSFVLERLVEREKLNTIVVNLYPGNKGYSLAFYQDDKQADNDSSLNNNNTNSNKNYSSNEGGISKMSTGSGGSGSSKSSTASSRHKQKQASSGGSNNSQMLAEHESGDIVDDSNNQDNEDIDEDENLVEFMRWQYEVDELLTCIDRESLPSFLADVLETRVPNVFYSGCVICQIRDFRQTFPISSNSCDIYHVLLRPTNDTLYSDIQKVAIEADISPEDRLFLESQMVLANAEPLCLDPDPEIGRFAFNSQAARMMFNTQPIRRQMKKYSQISINRKRKIDQFTHNYGLELCDYLQRIRQRPRSTSSNLFNLGGNSNSSTSSSNNTNSNSNNLSLAANTILSSFASKLPKKPQDIIKSIRTPNLDYPALSIPPDVNVEKFAKAYERPRETKDCMPQLIEEYILETDREGGRVYHIKLSIYQRPANSEYLGELYVDRDYKEGERNGEACQFSLGTRTHANRYIQQFTEIFTEEGRKSVKITHIVPGHPPKISCTTGMSEHRKQQQQAAAQQQQAVLVAAQQQQQKALVVALAQAQQQQQQVANAGQQQTTAQLLPQTISTGHTANTLSGGQLNINLQGGNIVGITTTGGNVQHIRQSGSQFIDASGTTMQIQAHPTHQLSLSNGSLVLVQQQPSGQQPIAGGLTIHTTGGHQKTQVIANPAQLSGTSALRSQLGSSVPILQAQLKAAPILTNQQQQQIIQQKVASNTMNSTTNQTINALVTGIMNSANQFQQQQQQTQNSGSQQQTSQQKTSSNAAILSLLNSAPAAMTNTPVASGAFQQTSGQQQTVTLVHTQPPPPQQQPTQQQHQTHQSSGTDSYVQPLQQRKQNEVIQNLLNSNLRKINIVSGTPTRTNTNLIAVNAVGLNQDVSTTTSNVRVSMSALASQLASPPAIMTNAHFSYNNSNVSANNNQGVPNNNSIKIINNSGQRVMRRDSTIVGTAAPSPGSDSNASNTSGTNLGFAMPGLSALLTTSPSPSSDHSQSNQMASSNNALSNSMSTSNQALLERLSSGVSIGGVTTNPVLSPQSTHHQQNQSTMTKGLAQQLANAQSPAGSITPMSSPPPQQSASPIVQPAGQTTTLNLQGINLTSLQGAMATFPHLQNVQVQIPGLAQPISLSVSGANLAAAVQQQQQQQNAAGGQSHATQQTTSLLVSLPVTSTTQVNTMQTVPGANATMVTVPATATQTVVLTGQGSTGNTASGISGSMLSLPIAQLMASGVKGLNQQSIRTSVANSAANMISSSNTNTSSTQSINVSSGNQSIQLLGTIPRNIQVVGAKQIGNRGQIVSHRNLTNSTFKMSTPITASQITTTANLTAAPLLMTSQKLQHQQGVLHPVTQQSQQQQRAQQGQQTVQLQGQQFQISASNIAGGLNQRTISAIAIANENQKRRRSATDVNK